MNLTYPHDILKKSIESKSSKLYAIAQSMKFTFELEDLMQEKNITLEEIAKVARLSIEELNLMFLGDKIAKKSIADAISKEYGVSFSSILEDDTNIDVGFYYAHHWDCQKPCHDKNNDSWFNKGNWLKSPSFHLKGELCAD